MCKQCNNYNPLDASCVWCEGAKNQELLCHHTDEQQERYLSIQALFKRPLSHIDDKPQAEEKAVNSLETEAALMEAEDTLGRVGLAQGTDVSRETINLPQERN